MVGDFDVGLDSVKREGEQLSGDTDEGACCVGASSRIRPTLRLVLLVNLFRFFGNSEKDVEICEDEPVSRLPPLLIGAVVRVVEVRSDERSGKYILLLLFRFSALIIL